MNKKNLLFNDNIKVSIQELESLGISKDLLNEEMYFINVTAIFGSWEKIDFVKIKRTEGETYSKVFKPRTYRLNSDSIFWNVRNKLTYYSKWSLYYSGLFITIPLDIVTSPFQFIFFVYVLFYSGFVK